jgi:hypothetical protein
LRPNADCVYHRGTCVEVAGAPGRRFCRLVAEINEPFINGAYDSTPEGQGEPGKGPCMKRSVAAALAALATVTASRAVSAQPAPVQCDSFVQIRNDAQQKALAIRTAVQNKADRKDICALVQRYYAAESVVVKFLEDNKTWCGIPEQAIKGAKDNHEHTLKFRTAACTEAPAAKPRAPSLSDAIGTPSVDTGANTKTGRGTLDSLNGNPLAR